MYEYLIGCIIIIIAWITAFLLRKDLRRPMIWSGFAYIIIITVWFFSLRSLFLLGYIRSSITPGYWNPNTLFNIGRITGGYAIEDVLFMFFIGGLATFVYEFFYKKRIKLKKSYKHHIRSPVIGIAASILFALIFKVSLMYSLIILGFAGGMSIWIERKDLIKHSLRGGLICLICYFFGFLIFITIFPDFINTYYNLPNTIGIRFFGIPIEEFFYAVGLGFIWSPIYEYEHGEKDVDL